MSDPFAELSQPDLEHPNAARMYDYHLGGSANFAIDREKAAEFEQLVPDMVHAVRCNRGFLGRVVRYLVTTAGIDQFLDLGSGIPTVGNVHEIAQQHNPAARVAYVDFEPIAVHHARRLLAEKNQRVTVSQVDIRDPAAVLAAPGVTGLLDFSRPVAVLAVGVLQFIHDGADELMATYRDATVPGSYAAVSHLSRTSFSQEQMRAFLNEMTTHTSTPDRERTPAEIARLLPGYSLLTPGVVPVPEWPGGESPTQETVYRSNCYGAVGVRH